jgi:SAM-dependent methyltransferase
MCIKEGWTGYGVEVSKGAAERAAAKGIPLLSSTWLSQSEPPIHPQQFDVICLINVLETLPDPIAALRRVRHALAPRGLVVIRVSNGRFHLAARRWVRWVGARYWQAFQSYLYTPKSMRQLLALAGLAPVSLRNSQPSRAPLTAGDRPVRRLIWKMAGLGLYGVAQVVSAVSAGQMLWAPSFEIIAGAEGETR